MVFVRTPIVVCPLLFVPSKLGKRDWPSRVLPLRARRPCQEMAPRLIVRQVSAVRGSCGYVVRVHAPPPVPRRRVAAPVTRLV